MNIKIIFPDGSKKEFESGKLHPSDLKSAVAEYLEKIISPIRKSWK